jgi:hypothetical protein
VPVNRAPDGSRVSDAALMSDGLPLSDGLPASDGLPVSGGLPVSERPPATHVSDATAAAFVSDRVAGSGDSASVIPEAELSGEPDGGDLPETAPWANWPRPSHR